MTRSLVMAAVCLGVTSLVGCRGSDGSSSNTLPPMEGPLAGPPRAAPVVEAEPPLLTSNGLTTASRAILGLDPYPTMRWLLSASGVLAEIGARPVTILAPSENAFRDFAVSDGYGLMAVPTSMAPILRRHVLLGAYDADQLVAAGVVTNLAGEQLAVWLNGRVVMVDDVALTVTSLDAGSFVAPDVVVFGADGLLLLAPGAG